MALQTIIECLKYATTGDQPPNTRGGAFVHDPKMANEKEVKAQVKLRFKAANGQTLMVTRNLSVSVKKGGGMIFRTLEGILSFASNDGPNGKVNLCLYFVVRADHCFRGTQFRQNARIWPRRSPAYLVFRNLYWKM